MSVNHHETTLGPNIVGPHLDDPVLSCWDQIEQPDSVVTTVFAGIPDDPTPSSWDKLNHQTNAVEAMLARHRENDVALNGISKIVNLTYLERLYRDSPPNPKDIADNIETSNNPTTRFFIGSGLGRARKEHEDHRIVGEVGRELLGRGLDVVLYVDIPYMLPVINLKNWPKHLNAEKIKRALDMDVLVDPVELSAEQQRRKREAVGAYKTQLTMTNIMFYGALSRPGTYKWEVLLRPQ